MKVSRFSTQPPAPAPSSSNCSNTCRGEGKARLKAKYQNELHTNEVAILPYYVANLNIENTFAVLNDGYEEFPGLVFVDTLDNTAGLAIYAGHQPDIFGGTSDENLERVKRQNSAKIKLTIGNPPYNAWQQDYNARNPNRPYRRVDERIGQTYRHRGNAQNTNSPSDIHVRFWRWASDRLTEDGVIAMVTNRNFIKKVAFDGFRKSIAEEFAECWLMDLGGDVRAKARDEVSARIGRIETGVNQIEAGRPRSGDGDGEQRHAGGPRVWFVFRPRSDDNQRRQCGRTAVAMVVHCGISFE